MQSTPRGEQGFTLIELMVVILIIGILAAIALPNFVSQRDRSYDARAKANARNTVTHVEACFVKTDDYSECTTLADLGTGIGIEFGPGKDQVEITSSGKTGYEIKAHSATGSEYRMKKNPGTWEIERKCTIAPGKNDAGCKNGSW